LTNPANGPPISAPAAAARNAERRSSSTMADSFVLALWIATDQPIVSMTRSSDH